ncbi:TLC domain-containing protein 3A-like [Patiria miniata]|uniref:TLC domain-containing protein n=1 Tax=Patiria miniata TaxID=46514 RepID=A0A914A6I7_PATMI|nr:TLC domain-containing protein 3A-like [Patiria miniata]
MYVNDDIHISIKMGLLLAGVGTAFFPLVYFSFRQLLKQRTAHLANSAEIVSVVAMRLTSILQALMSSFAGFVAICYCNTDLVHDRHWIINAYTHFGLPYMLYDILAMCEAFRQESKHLLQSSPVTVAVEFIRVHWLMIFHHLGLACICLPIILFYRNDKGDFFIGCMFMTEVSTPFVSMRAIMRKVKWDNKFPNLYLFVSVMLLTTFFVFRIMNFPFMYWLYGRTVGLSVWQVPGRIALKCNVISGLIFLFQCYWFLLILQAGGRMLTKMSNKPSGQGLETNGVAHKSH